MDTLAKRIEWILRTRNLSERELARMAQLKSESHVGLLLNPKPGKTPNPKVKTIEAIARAGGVSLQWLVTGEGSPDKPSAERRNSLIDEVGREIQADPRDIEVLQIIWAKQDGLSSIEEIRAEFSRQRQAREERKRDVELRRLQETSSQTGTRSRPSRI